MENDKTKNLPIFKGSVGLGTIAPVSKLEIKKSKKSKANPVKKQNTPTTDDIKKAEKEVEKLKKQQKNWNAMVEDILYPDDQQDDEDW